MNMNKYLYNDEITATLSQVTPLYPPYPKGGKTLIKLPPLKTCPS
jgi:hypothetical protein